MEKLLCNHQLRQDHAKVIQRTAASDMDARPLQEFRKWPALFCGMRFLCWIGGVETRSSRDASNATIEYPQVDQKPGPLLWPPMEAM